MITEMVETGNPEYPIAILASADGDAEQFDARMRTILFHMEDEIKTRNIIAVLGDDGYKFLNVAHLYFRDADAAMVFKLMI